MIYRELPRSAHLEISDRCNAGCPMCGRTRIEDGQESSYIDNIDLSYSTIANAFSPEYLKDSRFDYVNICGSFGDPLMNRESFEIIEHFASRGIETALATNASLRSEKWWYNLGKLYAQGHRKNYVYFAIDGIDQDTHEYYRRFTKLDKIFANAQAFIRGGGKAVWSFIVFKHNEHQIEEAERMSKEMGFYKFTTVKTDRFVLHDLRDGQDKLGRYYTLERPSDSKYLIDESHEIARDTVNYYRNYEVLLKSKANINPDIRCEVQPKGQIFVGANGYVFPCCYTYGFYKRMLTPDGELSHGVKNVHPVYPWDETVNLKNSSISDIVMEDFFIDLYESFNNLPNPACQKTCGYRYMKSKESTFNENIIVSSSD